MIFNPGRLLCLEVANEYAEMLAAIEHEFDHYEKRLSAPPDQLVVFQPITSDLRLSENNCKTIWDLELSAYKKECLLNKISGYIHEDERGLCEELINGSENHELFQEKMLRAYRVLTQCHSIWKK